MTGGVLIDNNSTDGSNSGIPFGYQTPVTVTYLLTSPTTYTATATMGATTSTFSGIYTGPITGIDVFNHGAGNGSDFAFNNLSVSNVNLPEPASLGALGMVGLAALRRSRR